MIKVDYVLKHANNMLEVVFSNGATQLFTYAMEATSGVFHNERELKAQRFTKKYNEALDSYMGERMTVVVNESNNGVTHNVYVVGETITAHKFIEGNHVQTYDWTGGYKNDTEFLIKDLSYSGHQEYTVYEILTVDEVAKNKANQVIKVVENFGSSIATENDLSNLKDTIIKYFLVNEKAHFETVVLDGSQSLHFIFLVESRGENYRQTYNVHSAFHNGKDDRTTYNGLHRGSYDYLYKDGGNMGAMYELERRIEKDWLGKFGTY